MLSIILYFVSCILFIYHISKMITNQNIINETIIISNDSKKDEYKKEIQQSETFLNNQSEIIENKTNLIYDHMKLWKLYYDGIPNKYDFQGNKIQGVSPNPKLALYNLNKAIYYGYDAGYLLLAKMYHYGFHDFDVDLERAKNIYIKIIDERLPNYNEAIHLLEQIYENERHKNLSSWLNIPLDNIKNTFSPKPFFVESISKPNKKNIVITNSGISEKIIDTKPFLDIQLKNRDHEVIQQPKITSDSQNVHDNILIRTVKQSINNLKKSTKLDKDMNCTVSEIRNYLRSKPDCNKKEDAIKVLDSIERNHDNLISFEMKETDLLHLVWNRIHDKHKDNKELLMENLYEQLASGVEHDKTVCSTGKFVRLLDTLNVIDDEVSIKSKNALNQELMNKGAMIRQKLYDSYNEHDKNKIDSLKFNDTQDNFTNTLKNSIKTQFSNDYVNSELLTQEELDNELNKWINEI